MWTYTPPLRDMQFVIEEVLAAPAGWLEMPAFAELDTDTARQVLAEAGKFASGARSVYMRGPPRFPAGWRRRAAVAAPGSGAGRQ